MLAAALAGRLSRADVPSGRLIVAIVSLTSTPGSEPGGTLERRIEARA